MRNTKIVCTIGPATGSRSKLGEMIRAGMDVARLNFSHGDAEKFKEWIRIIREESESIGKPVAILQDLPGPKIRLGRVKEEGVELKTGTRLRLTVRPGAGNENAVMITYSKLPAEVSVGDPIFIDDGHIRLKVVRTFPAEIETEVISGGKLRSEQGLNVPMTRLSIPSFSEHDLTQLEFGLEQGVDWVALSFVRRPEDIEQIRSFCRTRGRNPKLMAKIERREALEQLEPILKICDGVMVARGDLGVEIPVEQVPLAQKRIITLANRLGKPVVTATQMLESMVEHPWPTRAEVADVANAVLDGTDAVMLSQETAIGKYPMQAIEIMGRVILELENHNKKNPPPERRKEPVKEISEAVTNGACHIANQIKASIIVALTRRGKTAQRLSSARPHVPIVALTGEKEIGRQLMMYWGVMPLVLDHLEGLEHRPETVFELIRGKGMIAPGDSMILTGGLTAEKTGETCFVRVIRGPEPTVP